MAYIERHLSEGEEIVFATRIHPIVVIVPAAASVLGLLLLLASNPGWGILGAFLLIIGGILLLANWVEYTSSEFAVTNRRVVIKWGLFSRSTMETLLTKVEGLQVSQGIFGRVFDYGTIHVIGTGGSKESFRHVKAPLALRKTVQDRAEAARNETNESQTSSTVADTQDAVIDKLERLTTLRDRGTLTPEEFEREKRRLLDND